MVPRWPPTLHLYHLPQVWADYDDTRKCFVDPSRVAFQIYSLAGLSTAVAPQSLTEEAASQQHVTPDPLRVQTARAALAAAERHTTNGRPRSASPTANNHQATTAQLGLIARLIGDMQRTENAEEAEAAADAINAIGERHAIERLATHTRREQLGALHLTKTSASGLIRSLKELQEFATTV